MIKQFILFFVIVMFFPLRAELLIPMDDVQTNHLKAYGVTFDAVKRGITTKWLLNYRGGSWLIADDAQTITQCNVRGVTVERLNGADVATIMSIIQEANMESVSLEKEPRIAVYTPPNKQPWDDAVTLALTYAQIDFDTVFDEEVLDGRLQDYDWLHLHHEDFTGQYGKFYGGYRESEWYKDDVQLNEHLAQKLGYGKVWRLKHAVAEEIRKFVANGGFLFAMCAATDTIDIALAAGNTDIVDPVYDGDGLTPGFTQKLDFDHTFAFTDFSLITNPYEYEFSSIDATDVAQMRGAEADYFSLFDFSAKYDPVPTMLTQCQTHIINGFLGQTTAFHKEYIKKSVIIMGEVPQQNEAKYIHGNLGKGTYTFYGGHDPEDYQHKVGDPETILDMHKNSPGYRLILNNVLFPAAEKKKLKT